MRQLEMTEADTIEINTLEYQWGIIRVKDCVQLNYSMGSEK